MEKTLTIGKDYKYKKAQLEIIDFEGRYTIIMILHINGEIIQAQRILTRLIPVDIALEETYKALIREAIKYLEK